ncbi:flagellar assembly protein FliW [Metabacillus litoralis]|uniref:flagellar assembly protein FliW n=1 Tax=Metabacillus litoralis TaxID=152268 RepID=UPI00204011BA|nr:flagellar assembly protein FliW [Metabacillus litoralis]MCM3162338.1 flagellar assembly protein FliW [Metabacillus litoralis]
MELNTKYHGVINIEEEEIIRFESGIPGFSEETKFILLPLEENSPYYIMQSLKTSELGFVVTEPFSFFKDYEFRLGESEKEALNIKEDSKIQVLSILSLKEPFSNTTANLQAPVVINHTNKLAKQIILNDTKYTTRHKLSSEVVKK